MEAFRKELDAIPENPGPEHRDAVKKLAAKLEKMGDFPEKEAFAARLRACEEQILHRQVEDFRKKLNAFPTRPNLDHEKQLGQLQLELSQLPDFPEKEAFKAQIKGLKDYLAPQKAQIKSWDEDMTKIVPAKLTLEDREKVEDLRSRYDKIPLANRKYLQYAGDLMMLEEKLLQLDDQGFPVAGEAKAPGGGSGSGSGSSGSGSGSSGTKPAGAQNGGAQRPSGGGITVTTTVESNMLNAKVRDGMVEAAELEKVKGKDKNLRMEGKLSNGKTYALVINGKDLDQAQDVRIGLTLGSKFDKEIRILGEEPFIFHLEQKGYFPCDVMVELPVELQDGTYMLLRYNEAERKAEYIAKSEVKGGKAAFVVEQGGDYFLAKKAISKSLNELEAPKETVPPTTVAPTEPAVTQVTMPAVTEAAAEESPVNGWLVAAITAGALALAGCIVIVVLLVINRKGKQ